MSRRTLSLLALAATLGCAEHHVQGRDGDVSADASTTICDFLITDAQPCPDDCLGIGGLVLHPSATCIDMFTPREIVWCATRGPISSFSGACYVLADGTRVSIQWTPANEPSDVYCSHLPNCVP